MNPRALSCHLRDSLRFTLIWDTGASVSLTYDKEDFVGEMTRTSTFMRLKGIAKGTRIEGIGYAAFSVSDSTGELQTLKTKAVYCPQSTVKLLSITALLQEYANETILMTATGLTLSGCKTGTRHTDSFYVSIDGKCNLPTSQAYRHSCHDELPKSLIAAVSVVERNNHNLGEAGKEWLRWHFRLHEFSTNSVPHENRCPSEEPSHAIPTHHHWQNVGSPKMCSMPLCKGQNAFYQNSQNSCPNYRSSRSLDSEHFDARTRIFDRPLHLLDSWSSLHWIREN
jgi:hypothetical protein